MDLIERIEQADEVIAEVGTYFQTRSLSFGESELANKVTDFVQEGDGMSLVSDLQRERLSNEEVLTAIKEKDKLKGLGMFIVMSRRMNDLVARVQALEEDKGITTPQGTDGEPYVPIGD